MNFNALTLHQKKKKKKKERKHAPCIEYDMKHFVQHFGDNSTSDLL